MLPSGGQAGRKDVPFHIRGFQLGLLDLPPHTARAEKARFSMRS